MSPQQTGGSSSRRRIAGEAARRRREEAASSSGELSPARAEPSADEVTEPEKPTDTESEPTQVDPSDESAEFEGARKPRRAILTAPPRSTWWWLAAVAVVTVCALVFVAVVGVRYLSERSDDEALAEAREDATSAAATSAEEILSYDYQSFDSERDKAGALMTDDFRKQYDDLYSGKYCDVIPEQNCTETGTFPEVIKKRKQTVDASVVNVAPLECGDDCSETKATVLLFIDQETESDGQELQPTATQAKFTMVERDGEWLVDGIV